MLGDDGWSIMTSAADFGDVLVMASIVGGGVPVECADGNGWLAYTWLYKMATFR